MKDMDIQKIKKIYKDYEFSILDNDNLAQKVFCMFFGVEINATSNQQSNKQILKAFLPTEELLPQVFEVVRYRKINASGGFGEYKPMSLFFDNEKINDKNTEYMIYEVVYSMVMFDLYNFFHPTSNE